MRILVRTFARYGADVVKHGTVFGGPQPLAGHVRRQHFGAGRGRPEVLRARERIRPRVRRYDGLRVAAVGRVRAAVAVGVAHRWTVVVVVVVWRLCVITASRHLHVYLKCQS